MLTHRNLVANVQQFKAFVPDALRPGQETIVTAIPLYHIFALMVNLGRAITHLTPALVPACGWMREARRSP